MVFKKILKSYGKSQLENIIYCSRGFHCRAFNFLPCAECFHFFPDFFSTAYAAFHGWQLNFSFRAEFINHIQQQPAARPSPNHPKTPTHFSSFIGLKRCLKLSVFGFQLATEWHATTAEWLGNGEWLITGAAKNGIAFWGTKPVSSVSAFRLSHFVLRGPSSRSRPSVQAVWVAYQHHLSRLNVCSAQATIKRTTMTMTVTRMRNGALGEILLNQWAYQIEKVLLKTDRIWRESEVLMRVKVFFKISA